ncbi:MAG: hypothetical protein ACXWQO_00015 [Bdellovibrionota bacterium]
MKKLLLLLAIPAISLVGQGFAYAEEGGSSPGGGESCEIRAQDIVLDISRWLEDGGAKRLKFRNGDNEKTFSKKMKAAIAKVKNVTCVSPGEPGFDIFVNKEAKECINFVDDKGANRIRCHRKKFYSGLKDKNNNPDQYRMVLHELASLAGLEKPKKDVSDYFYARQVTGYLEDTVVKRLAINPNQGTAVKITRVEKSESTRQGAYCLNTVNTLKGYDEKNTLRIELSEEFCPNDRARGYRIKVFSGKTSFYDEAVGLADNIRFGQHVTEQGQLYQNLFFRLNTNDCRILNISTEGHLIDHSGCKFSNIPEAKPAEEDKSSDAT